MKRFLILTALLTLPKMSSALTTAYVSFEQPAGWECELSSGVWICQSNQEGDRKESVLLSIASQATQWDSLDNYETYLKKPREIQDDTGRKVTSTVTYARRRDINGHPWIDSLQKNSELPGFWARYLATIKETKTTKLAILITYIISDEKYAKLAPQFERLVASLKPRADFDATVASKQGSNQILPGSTVMGQMQDSIRSRLAPRPQLATDGQVTVTEEGSHWGLIVALLLGAIGYVIWRRKKKN